MYESITETALDFTFALNRASVVLKMLEQISPEKMLITSERNPTSPHLSLSSPSLTQITSEALEKK